MESASHSRVIRWRTHGHVETGDTGGSFDVPDGLGAQVNINQAAPTVTVRVYKTSLRPSEFRSASELAARVLRAAGIAVSWVQCWSGGHAQGSLSADCERPLTQSDFIVHLIHAADPNSASHPESLGFSLIDAQAGTGFCRDRLHRSSCHAGPEGRVNGVDLLAWAMAHEIGHLLWARASTPTVGSCANAGLAQRSGDDSRKDWSFSVDEGQTLGDALRSREMAVPTSNTVGVAAIEITGAPR
jgi:hypothetical protein